MPVQITSSTNPKVKTLRSLHRRRGRYRERLFLVEGVRLVNEALQAGFPLPIALYLPERLGQTEHGAALLEHLAALDTAFPTTDAILDDVADTVTAQGVVAAVPFPDLAPRPGSLILVLDRIRDPGNCGTILRTAEAAGVGQVYLTPGTVDPFNPKVVRGGMGAHFRLPIHMLDRWEELVAALVGFPQVLLAEAGVGRPYEQVDWTRPTALIVGGEARGARERAGELATKEVTIPMAGRAESLNVAVATGILLFEALRQQRAANQAGR